MSHIRKETVRGFDAVHPLVLSEGIKVACQLLSLQGLKVTDHVFDWSGNKIAQYNGMKVICGLDAQGSASSHKFAGLGLAVDQGGKLAIVGDFYYSDQQRRAKELRPRARLEPLEHHAFIMADGLCGRPVRRRRHKRRQQSGCCDLPGRAYQPA